jgi:choice-of-anchor A domain-containing protein
MNTNKSASIVAVLLLSVTFHTVSAAECDKLPRPQDYQVCSGSDLTYQESDFQGPACAVGNVTLTNFALDSKKSSNCNSWTVGGNFLQENGSADGNVMAGGQVAIKKTVIAGKLKHGSTLGNSESNVIGGRESIEPEVAISAATAAWTFFEEQSKSMAKQTVTAKPKNAGGVMTLASKSNTQVFEIKAKDFQSAKVVKLEGTCSSAFIVNITGEEVVISGIDIQLSGRLAACPEKVFFNFPQAKSIVLNKSGTGTIGVAGTILAPLASLDFTDGLVTGGVFAKKITGSGQVNFSTPAWPEESAGKSAAPVSTTVVPK